MARQLLLVSLALAVAFVAGSCEAVRPHPDCSNTFTAQGASFSTINTVCGEITDPNLFQKTQELDPVKKLETVESCSCALVNHEMAWASLMSHELAVFYEAVRQLVDDKADKDANIKALTAGKSKVMFAGEDGERRFYWDALDYILKQATGENDDEEISLAIRQNFANLYYEPANFKLKFVELVQSQKLRMVISKVCDTVLNRFSYHFLPLFDRLAQLADNPQIFYMLTGYSEDLYKLRMVTRACVYLIDHGQLVNNF